MHNTTHGHKSDLTRVQRGSVTYRRRRRRDTNKPQGKLFPFSFSPKPQVQHSTTQQVGHISKTHYKQHSFGAQGSAEQLCLWELALFLPTLVIISLQYPLHQYSALEHEHCSLFISRARWASAFGMLAPPPLSTRALSMFWKWPDFARQIFMAEPKGRSPIDLASNLFLPLCKFILGWHSPHS